MEIIREGSSASRPPVLDGKNYSYWKPRMIFFIKTLNGKAWRALVAGYDPPMITVNGVSIPKPEVDWTDAEDKLLTAKEAWKTLEVAYEGTSKIKISRLQLITSKFEALRMTEDESMSNYNKRVLEIANESLMLAYDISTLKLDELFGSLLTFEIATADRENENTDNNEEDNGMNAFTVHITKTDSDDESESSEENDDNELTFEALNVL
ncbi:gag-pol polyprotein [Cucumis melo var. makuwa]|uniref:Gag-pol polyprotein n=1 Tax=Cucumis melo var. makuwa TaxID=1194695 RepID=A0A5A7T666_CUCMM|nr:gag-pol polyprotein [Cucumis melo var. makuwa]